MSIFVPNNSGTVTFTNGSTAIAGVGTLFTNYRAGSVISIPGLGEMQLATDPTSDTEAVGIVAWQGATAEDKAFQYLPRNEEGVFTDKLTQLLSDLGNGNLQALAGLALSASKVLVGTGPGALGLADRSEFVNGVRFNARVPGEAGLAAYATKPGPTEDEPGYTVLIEAYGVPPRTVLVSKASDTSGDWTDPAYVEGNIGEKGWTPTTIRVEDGERQVIKLSGYIGGEGDAPTANVGQYLKADGTWTATIGDALDVRGASFNWIAGGYNGANAYAKRDALRDQGAAWIALQAVPPGNPPPTLPATTNAHWDLMSEPGDDGDGTGDVVGPASSVDSRLVAFDGTTGKLLKEIAPSDARLSSATFMDFHVAGLKPDKLSTNVLRLYPGVAYYSNGVHVARSTISYDIDMSTTGVGGLDTGTPTDGVDYFVYILKRDSDGAFGAVISSSITYGGVTLPVGYSHVRKLRFGFVYNSAWDGIPDHDCANWPWPTVRLTRAEAGSLWRALNAGAATTNTAIPLGSWIPDNARLAMLMVRVTCGATAGTGYITASGAGHSNGIEFSGVPNATYTTYVPLIRISSTLELLYKVTGGVTLTVFVLGYAMTEPS